MASKPEVLDRAGQSTTVVYNKTNTPLLVTMDNATSAGRARTLALAGFYLAVVGMVPFSTAASFTAGVALAGYCVAAVGVADAFDPGSGGEGPHFLFPGESATRTSNEAIPLFTGNTIRYFRTAIDSPGNLLVQMGEVEKAQSETVNLTTRGMTTLFTIKLPQNAVLRAYRALAFERFNPQWTGNVASDITTTRIADGSLLKSHSDNRTVTVYAPYDISSQSQDTVMFQLDSTANFTLATNSTDTNSYTLLRASEVSGDDKNQDFNDAWFCVLKNTGISTIYDYARRPMSGDSIGRFLTDVKDVVKSIIQRKNSNDLFFTWGGGNSKALAFGKEAVDGQFKVSSGGFVILRAKSRASLQTLELM